MDMYSTIIMKVNLKLPPTKSLLSKKFDLLTAQSIIAKNSLVLMTKNTDFPSAQPKTVNESFPENAPNFNYSCDVFSTWLEKYNTLCYRNSMFFKGPMLYADYKRLNTELLYHVDKLFILIIAASKIPP